MKYTIQSLFYLLLAFSFTINVHSGPRSKELNKESNEVFVDQYRSKNNKNSNKKNKENSKKSSCGCKSKKST